VSQLTSAKMPHGTKGGVVVPAGGDPDEDPFDARIRKSGCGKFHYALQVGLPSAEHVLLRHVLECRLEHNFLRDCC
jgi:hypothetical protein